MRPSKNAKYRYKNEKGTWSIWEGEDFSDSHVLLYNDQTGEDYSLPLDRFYDFFARVK